MSGSDSNRIEMNINMESAWANAWGTVGLFVIVFACLFYNIAIVIIKKISGILTSNPKTVLTKIQDISRVIL